MRSVTRVSLQNIRTDVITLLVQNNTNRFIKKKAILETDRYHFVETDTDIFNFFFTKICPAAHIRLATDIYIPKLLTGISTK